MPAKLPLTNIQIAELLAIKAQSAKMPAQKALRRASRKAFLWPEEAGRLLEQKKSLQELAGVGPYIGTLIHEWLDDPPRVPSPPEIRTGFLSFPAANAILARRPAWSRRVRGDLQMHTVWSDGLGSIEDMARAALERGYQYIAITDHSKGLKIAGGIDEQQLREQEEEIAELNQRLSAEGHQFRVLRSIELNIDPQGNGDMKPEALERLDLVLGCFHSSLRRKDAQTSRYLAALRNPSIQILGHPRGRIYNYRMGLSADWPLVFDTAAELDKAVEIDAYPDRQDLSPDLVKLAARSGCRISLGTDSHGPQQLRFMAYALASALRGGIKAERILNFMSAEELTIWAAETRESSRVHRRAA